MPVRELILESAKQAVLKDRSATHGDPENNFNRIANLWNVYLSGVEWVEAYDVALMLALLKIARAQNNPLNKDNWIDLAGYAACGAECVKYEYAQAQSEKKDISCPIVKE